MEKLAKRFQCSPSTVHTAVKNTPPLREWCPEKRVKSPRAQSIDGIVADRATSRADDPSGVLPDEEVDMVMARLIEQATPEQRAELNAKTPDERRELARLVLEQGHDIQIEDHAKRGNKMLGRKP
jgi:hypothetical protein